LPDYSESETTTYQSQSPDEAALVSTARDLGFAFIDRTNNEVMVDILGVETRFRLLNIIEFTSARKRMSVIFRSPTGEIILYIKGADSVIFERLAPGQDEMLSGTTDHLNQFANEGLRTLCLAYRVISQREYEKWADNYSAALSSLTDREQAVEQSCQAIERDLTLLGATAIEDRLQEWVPECISKLRRGGIKIWMCTGDKTETAINIGFSCNLLSTDMLLVVIKGGDKQSTVQQIVDAMRKCFAIDVSDLSAFRNTSDPDEITERLLARQVPHNKPLP
jgi:phospholipid-translocating ATPase